VGAGSQGERVRVAIPSRPMQRTTRPISREEREALRAQVARVVQPGSATSFAAVELMIVVSAAGIAGWLTHHAVGVLTTDEDLTFWSPVIVGALAAIATFVALLRMDRRSDDADRKRWAAWDAATEITVLTFGVRRAWHIRAGADWTWLLMETGDGRCALCTCDFVPREQIDEPRAEVTVEFFPGDDASVSRLTWSGARLSSETGEIEAEIAELGERPSELTFFDLEKLPSRWREVVLESAGPS
jgi:hypothetical protein